MMKNKCGGISGVPYMVRIKLFGIQYYMDSFSRGYDIGMSTS